MTKVGTESNKNFYKNLTLIGVWRSLLCPSIFGQPRFSSSYIAYR